ncbi:MAG: methylamine utilization protein MauG [Gammaproteobacteria bacterium]|nr:MAG: methylamine utilization protein MauG [Gammaproteobacteria bacterium]
MFKNIILICFVLSINACGSSSSDTQEFSTVTKSALGNELFHDKNLSLNRTQSCATCHASEQAFIDIRLDAFGNISAVSVGDDGFSLGDRNTPMAAYAQFSPDFHIGARVRHQTEQNAFKNYAGALGGQFLDGRELDLKGQASAPPLNPVEMNMPDKASVVARLQENDDYIVDFTTLFGSDIFDDTDAAYAAMAESMGEFEKTIQFAPFDSKYDRSLTGAYTLTFKENAGRAIFFSQFANCGICHQLHAQFDLINRTKETFTGYEYHNLGVPENAAVRALNGVSGPDNGLQLNTGVDADRGKFKVPTLRNVAVTEPYMHNGVFRDLTTVIEFYNHISNRSEPSHQMNPETGLIWELPEVADNISIGELASGDVTKMDSVTEIENMVCFLRILTDAKYEHLIQEKGIICH